MTALVALQLDNREWMELTEMQSMEPKEPAPIRYGLLTNIAFGLGMLAFLLAPMLIPGTSFGLAVLESTGAMLFAFVCLCGYGALAGAAPGLRRQRRR